MPKSTLGVNVSITLVKFAAQYCFLLVCHKNVTIVSNMLLCFQAG